ncbi:MAG: hypothetical protein K0Q58_1436 [Microbacterium sp.]|nr:hypothetical protein [Microbacterium sp.]
MITARNGPIESGITCVIHPAMAVTMPVPPSTPTSTPAASTIDTTPTMLGACATISSACIFSFGKLMIRATAAPTMNTNASGKMSITSSTITARVSARFTQISLGRSVARFGSSIVSAIAVSAASTRSAAATPRRPPATVTMLPVRSSARAPTVRSAPRNTRGARNGPSPDDSSFDVSTEPARRRRSERPRNQAKASETMRPAMSEGTIGTKMSSRMW